MEKISVCMATYNGDKYIKKQIDSVLSQLNPNDELIISDDGSTDNTLDIINSYNDSRIILLNHSKSKPPFKFSQNAFYATRNFENAIKYSNGDFIFLCDQDDIWKSDKISVSINELKKGNYGVVVSSFDVIDCNDKFIYRCDRKDCKTNLYKLVKSNLYNGCLMCITRTFIETCTPFPENLNTHDGWIAMNAVIKNKLKVINVPLVSYRVHQNNVSKGTNSPLWYKLYYRMYLLLKAFINIKKNK